MSKPNTFLVIATAKNKDDGTFIWRAECPLFQDERFRIPDGHRPAADGALYVGPFATRAEADADAAAFSEQFEQECIRLYGTKFVDAPLPQKLN
jgi:hypothetical protein